VDTSNVGSGILNHPNTIPGKALRPDKPSADRWYNRDAFDLPPDCRNEAIFKTLSSPLQCYGTSGRNTISGPGLVNFDFALLKNFRVGEAGNLQFRTEFFNLFNTPPLGFPVNQLSSPAAGTILAAGSSRQIQFALRYSF